MRSERRRIDRRLSDEAQPTVAIENGSIVLFRDPWGAAVQRFELGQLNLPAELVAPYAEAFRGHHAASSPATRHQCWNALKFFARFLAEGGSVRAPSDLTTELFGRYILWLDALPSRTGKPCALGLRHNRYQPVKLLTEWIARRRSDLLPVRPSFPFNPFPGRHASKEGRRLSGSQLKAILRACYEEIDDAWALFEEGQRLLAASATTGAPDGLEAMLREIHRIGRGVMPSRRTLPDWFGRRLHLHGGHDRFERHLHATPDCLAPFFIAIAIQTAGNAEALRLIDRDCIEPHPLIEHRTMIDWQKGRAGHLVKRAQRRSFDRRRRYAVPNLIDKLLRMTAPLAARAPASERDQLFLMRRPGRDISVVQRTTLEGAMARFVERANRRIDAWNADHPDQPRVTLPSFHTRMFRGSVAIEHYLASGGDVRAAQTVLNHGSPEQTDRYIRGDQSRTLEHETISRLQTMMLSWILGTPGASGKSTPASPAAAEAFGHRCSDPTAGGEKLCPHFGGCLSCPGLVVPLDAAHLARILLTIEQLEKARTRLDPQRWAVIYKPSHDLLVENILPDFPTELHGDARALMPSLPALLALE
ncbi:site-specific integrase [Bradyrhizobium sp. CCGUVB1N3]|uniref:site-specific integrase n=1 Tax=Bradyrhizobium sp. CCGUVB1N3 TaxID=2949629 RepID=UPI0020B3F5F6|nr:site-specific integrase [Bradyrhizobium sp. CCGUVB1N3]MCP3475556.1 site-specific integrase [Bradyrhizobium sp. CCGUVB1N3]MCP3476432.1 site-specific integrase [Bradyrhizobium sp. CCGUVB1N3]